MTGHGSYDSRTKLLFLLIRLRSLLVNQVLQNLCGSPLRGVQLKNLLASGLSPSLALPGSNRTESDGAYDRLRLRGILCHLFNERHIPELDVLDRFANVLLHHLDNLFASNVLRAIQNVLDLVVLSGVLLSKKMRRHNADVVRVNQAGRRAGIDEYR